MATLPEILERKWADCPDIGCTQQPDGSYIITSWSPVAPRPQPTLAEVMAFDSEVSTVLAAERIALRQQKILNQSDAVLQALEVMVAAVADLQAKARVTSALTQTNVNRVAALTAKLAQIRAS